MSTASVQREGMVPRGPYGQVTDGAGTREPEAIGVSDERTRAECLLRVRSTWVNHC